MSKRKISLHSCSTAAAAVEMSKRKISLHNCSTAAAPKPQQHLFLVLDDWDKGYSVRKVDLDALDYANDDCEPDDFSEPPLARFDVVHGHSYAFVAHGTKIVAMKPHEVSPAIPAFDTATSAVGILPWPEFRMSFGRPILVSIDGRLFLFINRIHYLGDPPVCEAVYAPAVQKPWVWTSLDSPRSLLPFTAPVCYAVHPDGRTLVVSSRKWRTVTEEGTFSFDTKKMEWTRHGDWQLPFRGQAHYVSQLDAWIGMCHHKGGIGHLCSSDVVPVAAGATTLPRWKLLGEERLFDPDSPLHLGATLVHMGGTRFCLVESMWHKADEDVRQRKGKESGMYVGPPRVVIRMTTFDVQYDKDGELLLQSRRTHGCRVFRRAHDKPDSLAGPVAFWL
uniref:DUF1618 domain-containing protein n=2 Tax=Triticum aestivum TaxID=4565 RepID=A0A9R1IQM2_WHEAT|nr:uncharacterized protein LOC119320677 [Triticum dicoccoides]KAF6988954.1 hypothetical protein CFC21_006366 [Triticum aestivum]